MEASQLFPVLSSPQALRFSTIPPPPPPHHAHPVNGVTPQHTPSLGRGQTARYSTRPQPKRAHDAPYWFVATRSSGNLVHLSRELGNLEAVGFEFMLGPGVRVRTLITIYMQLWTGIFDYYYLLVHLFMRFVLCSIHYLRRFKPNPVD